MSLKRNLVFTGIFIFLTFFITKKVSGQDSLRIYDLSFSLIPELDTSAASGGSDLDISVFFRIGNLQEASEVYVLIGLNMNSSECLNETYNIVQSGQSYTLQQGSNTVNLSLNAGRMYYSIPAAQVGDAKYITVYVKDIYGNYSIKQYSQIQ